jgi:hypothetical protein
MTLRKAHHRTYQTRQHAHFDQNVSQHNRVRAERALENSPVDARDAIEAKLDHNAR